MNPDLQVGGELCPDARRHGVGFAVGVDDAEAGVGCGEGQEPGAGFLLEGEAHVLEPEFGSGAGIGAGEAESGVEVEEERQVGFDPDHQGMQAVDGVGQIAAGDALEDAGRVGETVGDHDLAPCQGRADGLFQMVAAGGGEEQDLGFRRPAVGGAFKDEAADFLGPCLLYTSPSPRD